MQTRAVHALLSSCRQAAVIALAAAMPASIAVAGPGSSDRPHLGSCDTVVRPQPSGILEIDLSCRFRHLGNATGLIVQQITPTGPPVNGVLPLALSATVSYAAANGDVLRGTFTGSASIDLASGNVEYEVIEIYAGGTGRFVNASGRSFLQGTASTATNTGFYVTTGTLSY